MTGFLARVGRATAHLVGARSLGARSLAVNVHGRFYSTDADLDTKFTDLVAKSKQLKDDPGNDAKLKLYGLFKQATAGPNTAPKPGKFDIVGKYKYEAWAGLGDMSKDDAKKKYIDELQGLIDKIGLQN